MVFVTGFQGNTTDHQITTLGAGGSDYTAVALTWIINETPRLPFGEKLEVEPLQIFKEVDGVMSANPKSLLRRRSGADHSALDLRRMRLHVAPGGGGAAAAGGRRRRGSAGSSSRCAISTRRTVIPRSARWSRRPERTRPPRSRISRSWWSSTSTASPRLALQISERLERERLVFFQVSGDGPHTRFAVRPLKYGKRGYHRATGAGDARVSKRSCTSAIMGWYPSSESRCGTGWRRGTKRRGACSQKGGISVSGIDEDAISLSYLMPEADRTKAVTSLHKALVR